MKKTLYLTILAIVTVICIIIGSVYHIAGWFGNMWFGGHSILGDIWGFITDDDSSRRDRSHVTYSEDLSAFDKIEIDTSVMDVTVNTGDTYHLEYDCLAYLKPDMSVKGRTFSLEQPEVRWPGSNNKCSMILTVPTGTVLNSTDISSNVGNISMYNIESGDITVDADVGDITVESCSFESSDIQGNVGNINARTSNLGKFSAETDTGDIKIETCEFKDIDIYNDVGDVKLDTNNIDISGYEIDLSTDVGSVHYNGKNHKKYYYQPASGSSSYSIEIETDIGDVIFN